jgi:hypothetical protein
MNPIVKKVGPDASIWRLGRGLFATLYAQAVSASVSIALTDLNAGLCFSLAWTRPRLVARLVSIFDNARG